MSKDLRYDLVYRLEGIANEHYTISAIESCDEAELITVLVDKIEASRELALEMIEYLEEISRVPKISSKNITIAEAECKPY